MPIISLNKPLWYLPSLNIVSYIGQIQPHGDGYLSRNFKPTTAPTATLRTAVLPWPVWLGWLEHHPVNWKILGLIPTPGLQVWSPVRVCMRGNQSMFLSHIDVSLPLSPSLPLSLKSISMSSGEDKKKCLRKKNDSAFLQCGDCWEERGHTWRGSQIYWK